MVAFFNANTKTNSWEYLRKYMDAVPMFAKYPGLLRCRAGVSKVIYNHKLIVQYLEMKQVPEAEAGRHKHLLARSRRCMSGFAPLLSAETVEALKKVAMQRSRNDAGAARAAKKRSANGRGPPAKRRRSAASKEVDAAVRVAREADRRNHRLNDLVPVNGARVSGVLGLQIEH